MCGIVGYIGKRDALDVIIRGLEKLEYRGYDSAGVAVHEGGQVVVKRAQGKLAELKKILGSRSDSACAPIGIGHTRWATHGKPSEENAHPHTAGRVSLIHNGIIENYVELREELGKSGIKFKSETDTEIAAHLVNHFLEKGEDPFRAVKSACARIRGSYAFVVLDSEHCDRLIVAKNSTPIIVGLGEGEVFVASDIPAVLEYTRNVVVLEDGDIAEVKIDAFKVEHQGQAAVRTPQIITWDPVTAQKGGYKHYMLKEIHEQVEVLTDVLRGRIDFEKPDIDLSELPLTRAQAEKINRIILVACGTAWHACLVAKFYIEALSGVPCEVDYASEFRYRRPVFDERTMVIAVTQSGETADTLAALEMVRKSAHTLAICNVLGSSVTRKVDDLLFSRAGPEISVASTKAFTTQLVSAYLLAIHLGKLRGTLDSDRISEHVKPLINLPTAIDGALRTDSAVLKLARKFHGASDFLFLGRGLCYPIALEGALKLKEISYIHAEGYPAGEMKHGPIALISESMPVVVVLQREEQFFEKTLSNLREVESREGRIIAVTDTAGNAELRKLCEEVIEVPYISQWLSPVLLTIPLQLLAYHVAVLNGTDVDLPRNLAKSVTVE